MELTQIGTVKVEPGLKGKAVCLVSGGIDSPVAAYLAMRSGLEPICAYFDYYPFGGGTQAQQIATDTMRKLKEQGKSAYLRAYVIPHGPDLEEISRVSPLNLGCVISRRQMLRVAEKICGLEGGSAVVTGDSIGQKASQTLHNLSVLRDAAPTVLVVTPVLTMNKTEIERIARRIGTYEISIRPGVASCGIEAPKPRTKARREEIQKVEAQLDLNAMTERAIQNAEIIRI